MVSRILSRSIFHGFKVTLTNETRLFSASTTVRIPVSVSKSHYRKRILLANLLQRYGFPPSRLQDFLSRNNFLLNFDLVEIERSLGILLSFKIPQKALVSLLFDCPGLLQSEFLRKWQVGLSGIDGSIISSSAVRSVLEHSSRLGVDPYRFFECLRVLRGLGFSDSTISRVFSLFPKVLVMKEIEIRLKIDFLVGIGIPHDNTERFLYVFPEILGLSIENRLRPLLDEFRKMGFSMDDIRTEIAREPRILGLELGELSRCFELLRTLKCREVIKERIFHEGAFRAGFEVKLRVDCLCKHGLTRRDAFQVLWKEPRVILYEIEEIEKKLEFLTNRMRFNIGCLAEVPEYLGVSLEKQTVPRYNVIDYLRSKGGLGYDIGLKGLIKPSMKRFYNLYVKPYPECERLFGRSHRDVSIRKRHPAGLWKLFRPPSHPQTKEDVENIQSFVESFC